jgi:hypothetical protein
MEDLKSEAIHEKVKPFVHAIEKYFRNQPNHHVIFSLGGRGSEAERHLLLIIPFPRLLDFELFDRDRPQSRHPQSFGKEWVFSDGGKSLADAKW